MISNLLHKLRSALRFFSEYCPVRSWKPLRMETAQHVWTSSSIAWLSSRWKSCYPFLKRRKFKCSICSMCFDSRQHVLSVLQLGWVLSGWQAEMLSEPRFERAWSTRQERWKKSCMFGCTLTSLNFLLLQDARKACADATLAQVSI